ncbi:hypothetical protein [Caballeronia sp. dw_19]|uniref:hypothetical protein n=1 Tax=Caballeronia sp. dw_19 TaxID=2719791 RepID=UPI001BD39605|nr:hypothetical protein [Caballeronia sp. dw_19]
MHRILVYVAFGWLALGGVLHFGVDVASQYLRGKRSPSLETTLYYGLNTAFAFGQVLFGLLCLWLAWRALETFKLKPVIALCLAAAAGWLGITFGFMEYWEPKMSASIFVVLVLAVAVAAWP